MVMSQNVTFLSLCSLIQIHYFKNVPNVNKYTKFYSAILIYTQTIQENVIFTFNKCQHYVQHFLDHVRIYIYIYMDSMYICIYVYMMYIYIIYMHHIHMYIYIYKEIILDTFGYGHFS